MDRQDAGKGDHRLRLGKAKSVAVGAKVATKGNAITSQTPITIGLVILVVGVSFGAIFKAGQVLTELDYVKSAVSEIRSELRDIKYLVRQSDPGKRSYNDNQDLGHGPYSTAQVRPGSFE